MQPKRAIAYIRVSTSEQAESGLGLAAQEARLRDECKHRELRLIAVIADEGISGSTIDRPGLTRALEMIAARRAEVLLVAKLDRLSRSVIDSAELIDWFRNEASATLIALDLGIDTSTAAGELVANLMATIAQWERKVIGERTKAALAALRAQGRSIGRPAVADHPGLLERIRELRFMDDGVTVRRSFREICDVLNAEHVPTLRGAAVWRPSAVQSALGYQRPRRRRKRVDLPEAARA